ncbi:hypothetical protein HanXRQr2_Chr02g0080591 [Helianthus annuus]|uniref:Uncharacterized protein n=1 Tax=Helianthus annuus TaxID=4232 RepID=A0A9K3JQV9_HELAN|nr:hypothetical protein HanXRQr2_Chr02g0080591 [Helianthus annuus]
MGQNDLTRNTSYPKVFFFFHRKCVKYGYQILHCFVIIQIISLFFFFFFFCI